MSEDLLFLLLMLVVCLGGAWGAHRAGQPAWKGPVIIVVASAASVAALTLINSDSTVLSVLISLVAAGLTGRALKMTGRQIGMVILGSFTILIPVFVILALVR